MEPDALLNRYLGAQTKATAKGSGRREQGPKRPFVTISREAGAGAFAVGQKVADILNDHPHDVPWTVLDKDLVEIVLLDHHLPQELSKYMPEEAVNTVGHFIDDVLGHHPPLEVLVRKTNETMIALAQMGDTILIGRGGNFLTRDLGGGLHVRLVAPTGRRIQHLREHYGMSEREAVDYLKKTDKSRQDYVRDVFKRDVADILNYDCVLNTALLSYDAAAGMIAGLIQERRSELTA